MGNEVKSLFLFRNEIEPFIDFLDLESNVMAKSKLLDAKARGWKEGADLVMGLLLLA